MEGVSLGRLILIVDDDAELLRLYTQTLEPAGFDVRCSRDGAEALAPAGPLPELIILDAHLPAASGFELADQLRRTGYEGELLFVSGVYKAARHRDDVIDQFRAFDFLEKPVTPDELLASVRGAFASLAPTSPTPIAIVGPPDAGSLQGDLAVHPFHELVAMLQARRATGQLGLRRDKVKKLVRFEQGDPVAVKSNLVPECLGRVLVRAGLIDEQQCAASLELMRTGQIRQGEALVRLGAIGPEELEDALELQLEFKLYSIFEWESGEFQFIEGSGIEPVELRVAAPKALYEGLSRTWDEARLKHALGPDAEMLSPRLAPHAPALLELIAGGGALENFAAAVDGTRSLSALLDANMVTRTRALSLLVALRALGACELLSTRPPPVAPRTEDLAERIPLANAPQLTPAERAEQILRADESFREGRAAFDAGRFRDAVPLFQRAVDGYPEEALFHAWLGLAIWNARPEDARIALEHVEHARRLDAALKEAALFAGHLHHALGQPDAATLALDHARALGAVG